MQKNEGWVLWLIGPTSSGKTTIAENLIKRFKESDLNMIHFDGDEVRKFFGKDLGFLVADRLRVVETLVYLANKCAKVGMNVVVSALTANEDARELVMNNINNLHIGYVKCSIECCAQRDPKNLYKLAKEGKIDTLIGFNTAYDPPQHSDITLNTEKNSVEEILCQLESYLSDLSS
jgi:adenylylsulfate kinase